jgi:hypothetical protein
MEPRAATPARRLEAVRALSAAGVPTAVMFAPVIPALNDHELEAVLEASAEAGATTAGYVVIRLPREIASLFQQWLSSDHPGRAARVMSLIRQTRGGADYTADWGSRQKGEGPVAELIAARFAAARRRFGLDGEMPPMDLTAFKVPAKAGDQMDLFGEVAKGVKPNPVVAALRGGTANPVHRSPMTETASPLPVGTAPCLHSKHTFWKTGEEPEPPRLPGVKEDGAAAPTAKTPRPVRRAATRGTGRPAAPDPA